MQELPDRYTSMPVRIFRSFIAIMAWFAVGLQYVLLVTHPDAPGLSGATVNFFSYFTILTNILVAISMSASTASPNGRIGQFFLKPGVRTAITLYILIVAVVYHLVLRSLWAPSGWQAIADNLLHYGTPLLVLLDWWFLTPKKSLRFVQPIGWMWYPIIFSCYTLVRGQISGIYPYPFLDVQQIGWAAVGRNIVGLVAVFLVGGLLLVVIGRMYGLIASAQRNKT